MAALTAGQTALRRAKTKLNNQLSRASTDMDTMYDQMADMETRHEGELERLQSALEQLRDDNNNLTQELKEQRGERRGRPSGHRGREQLEMSWATMSERARSLALWRHTNDIIKALYLAGAIDWLPSCFALALKATDMLPELWASRVFAELKLEFVKELRDVLHAEWGVALALFVRSELTLSDCDYEKLRLAFCKR